MQEEKLFRKDFVFIIIINFLVFLNHLAILATFPFYIEALGGSEAVAGMAVALFCVVSVVCRPFIGWMLDNGKRKMILAVGLLGMLLMPLGYLFLHTLVLAFVCRMVHGGVGVFQYVDRDHCDRQRAALPFCGGHGDFRLGNGIGNGGCACDWLGIDGKMRIFRAVSVREPFDCACTGAVFPAESAEYCGGEKAAVLKGTV